MRKRLEPRQSQKTAGAFDGVNQPEDVVQNLGIVRLLLELHQLIVDGIQALAGLRQKLSQKIIHEIRPSPLGVRTTHFPSVASFYGNPLSLVERLQKNGLNKWIIETR